MSGGYEKLEKLLKRNSFSPLHQPPSEVEHRNLWETQGKNTRLKKNFPPLSRLYRLGEDPQTVFGRKSFSSLPSESSRANSEVSGPRFRGKLRSLSPDRTTSPLGPLHGGVVEVRRRRRPTHDLHDSREFREKLGRTRAKDRSDPPKGENEIRPHTGSSTSEVMLTPLGMSVVGSSRPADYLGGEKELAVTSSFAGTKEPVKFTPPTMRQTMMVLSAQSDTRIREMLKDKMSSAVHSGLREHRYARFSGGAGFSTRFQDKERWMALPDWETPTPAFPPDIWEPPRTAGEVAFTESAPEMIPQT